MPIKFSKQLKRPPWLTRSIFLWATAAIVGLGIAIALATGSLKSGFGAGTTTATSEKTDSQGKVIERTITTTPQDPKTLWDWLSLGGVLAVPITLAILAAWLQHKQQERELKIAEDNRQEEALQNYYDKVSALLVEKNLLAIAAKKDDATPEEKQLLDVSVDVIRARTLTTLRRLDKTRKTSLIQFLLESEVISKLNLSLAKADLTSANLFGAKLNGANLRDANLRDANLREANLIGANLIGADLGGANLTDAIFCDANLRDANLREANLIGDDLSGADLSGAYLSGAYLKNADLNGATVSGADLSNAYCKGAIFANANLRRANLNNADLSDAIFFRTNLMGAKFYNAKGLTKEPLEEPLEEPLGTAYLCRTELPGGIGIDPDRDCSRIAEFLVFFDMLGRKFPYQYDE